MIHENLVLAPYACYSSESKGRVYAENPSKTRTEFQRDHDRIIHSASFRRLEYKTQVFINHEGDLFRTRLTHSIEVAQIARTAASRLALNCDLTGAIALAHDLGHTPFGHAGQTALNECMRMFGGFEHNLQSLRIVDKLEDQYPAFDGLNLTWETREGILKHCNILNAMRLGDLGKRFLEKTQPSLEAQLVNIADAIAYSTHDMDDGLRCGLLTHKELFENVPIYRKFFEEVEKQYPGLPIRRSQKEVVRRVIGYLVDDLVTNSSEKIQGETLKSVQDVRNLQYPLIAFSDEGIAQMKVLKSYLMQALYKHYQVLRVMNKSSRVIQKLFEQFTSYPELLPPNFYEKAINGGVQRTVADYVAGMTDRYAVKEYERVFNPSYEASN